MYSYNNTPEWWGGQMILELSEPCEPDCYRIYHMYSDRQAWANSIDPDETPQNAASHLGLHCLPLIQQFLDTTSSSELYWFKL